MTFEQYEVVSTEVALRDHISRLDHPSVAASLVTLLDAYGAIRKTSVIENDYVDVDYTASYYEQRGRSFTPSKRGTTRIHFFSEKFTKRRLINASERTIRLMKSSYLGFTVVRPDQAPTLGRTFITCPSDISGRPARFPTRGRTLVDLAGIPLELESCPYMSQDNKIMACATAALWMSTSPLAEKIPGVISHTTAEITSMAMSLNRPYGPVIGRRGLTIPEMEQALLEIGFDPRIELYPRPEELVGICHLFSDSGIPPVLAIETNGVSHAVTVVGYTLETSVLPQTLSSGIYPAQQFVPNLILHDDLRGMYLLARANPVSGNPRFNTELSIEVAGRTDNAFCTAIFVPFPRRVMLDAVEVQEKAEEWIRQVKQMRGIEDRDVIYRTLLVRSNVLKQTLLSHRDRVPNSGGYPKAFVDFARSLPMPRYVWLIEISYRDGQGWDPSNPTSPSVIADLVLDSTSTETTRLDLLMLHLPNLVVGTRFKDCDDTSWATQDWI